MLPACTGDKRKELWARTFWHQRQKNKESSEKEHGHQRKSQSFGKKIESVFWQLFCIDIKRQEMVFLFFSKQPIAEKCQKKSPQELQQWWNCPGFVATFPKTWQILAQQKVWMKGKCNWGMKRKRMKRLVVVEVVVVRGTTCEYERRRFITCVRALLITEFGDKNILCNNNNWIKLAISKSGETLSV